MAFIERDTSAITAGSIWKLVYRNKQNPDLTENPSFTVGDIMGNSVNFGQSSQGNHDTYRYSKQEFFRQLVPFRKNSSEKAQLSAVMVQLANCPDNTGEIYEMLVELEI